MICKDREQRYPTAEDLIIDLECLLNDQPPKLARRRIAAGTLEGLAKGEAEEDSERPRAAPTQSNIQLVWLAILGGLLTLSMILNLFLLLRR